MSGLTARFVVHWSKVWAEYSATQYFLKPMAADWDPDEDEDDPVAQVLYEVAQDAIPADFEFTHKDRDSKGSWMGEEGILLEVFDEHKRFTAGEIVDITITVVGRVEFK